ncbi:MAG: hypothetical protein RBR01_09435 [Desulfobacterales bacterium]|jgi:hypothetical protein|nr:hypothetical protein [Desulfobacterales bacterium]MDD3081784.1 hypothetical protein [Desulfobacterales bacterium]MDD3949689.1 hypothetical protein [Desulfobacterales bacterium]MDD4464088.1 hypothetical protein [Desulfobacterales bacterium]MDY0378642.1 hypothetical protein [Desulfobacterales bacterium]
MSTPKKKEKKQKPREVHFEYTLSHSYAVHMISGCYGGINVNGNIVANFFAEQHSVPETEILKLDENGKACDAVKPIDDPKHIRIARFVPFAIAMRSDTARAIALWLNKHADDLESAAKQEKENGDGSVLHLEADLKH